MPYHTARPPLWYIRPRLCGTPNRISFCDGSKDFRVNRLRVNRQRMPKPPKRSPALRTPHPPRPATTATATPRNRLNRQRPRSNATKSPKCIVRPAYSRYKTPSATEKAARHGIPPPARQAYTAPRPRNRRSGSHPSRTTPEGKPPQKTTESAAEAHRYG